MVSPGRSATSTPVARRGISPCHSTQPSSRPFITAVPRVSVMSSVRTPMRPRVGTWNSRRTRPEPWFTIFVILPLRMDIFSSTTPM